MKKEIAALALTGSMLLMVTLLVLSDGKPSAKSASPFVKPASPLVRNRRATACDSDPCLNSGQCIDGGGSYTCTCTKKFIGDTCDKECGPVDIGLILDVSGSIKYENWVGSVVPFVEYLIGNLTIGAQETKIGAVGFSDASFPLWDLNEHSTEADLLGAIQGVDYNAYKGATNSPAGLTEAKEKIFQKSKGDRDGVPNIGIFFNDGKCNRECDKLVATSNALKDNRDTIVYSIAIGPAVILDEVAEVASDPDSDFLLQPASFEDLLNFIKKLKEGLCKSSKIDYCASAPCKNGGQCQNGPSSAVCTCAAGYTGQFCDIDIDECLSSPCKNGAQCTNGVNKYTCDCPAGFKGTNCENIKNNCDVDDICFVLDSSASLMVANWENVKLFTNKVVEGFAIGPNDVQVGVTIFSSDAYTPIKLDNGLSKNDLMSAITSQPFSQTGTATHLGLADLKDKCFNSAGDRANSRNKAFLITDGRSLSLVDTTSAALAARNSGITIFAIGVGRASKDELLAITGNDAGKVFTSPDFTTLLNSVSKIVGNSCDPKQDVNGCDPSPCQNSGTCTNTMGAYACNCSNTKGFTGPHCEVAPAKDDCKDNNICFLVDASSSIPPLQEWQDMLTFVTSVVSGLPSTATVGVVLFSLDGNLLIPLGDEPDRNKLNARIQSTPRSGGSTMTHLGLSAVEHQCFAGPNYHANTWNKAFLLTDGKSKDTDLTTSAANSLRNKADIYAIGVGRYNYTELKLITGEESRIFTALRFSDLPGIASTVLAGACKSPDLCNPNPCKNSGACTSSGSTFACTCLPGWTGTVCDTPVDACSSSPCKNGGQCSPIGTTSFSCTCLAGWTGTNCDIPATNGCTKDDVCLLVDASGSILQSQWIQVKDFLKILVNEWTIGPNDVQVGVVVFSSNATVAWNLNTYSSKSMLSSQMDTLIHFRQGTATDQGLDMVRTACFGGPGQRSASPDKMFLITDGRSKDGAKTLEAATKLRQNQVDNYVIGIGNRLDMSELLGVTGNDASKVIISTDFNDLAAKAKSVISSSCNLQAGPTNDPCNPNPCNNGGACSASGSQFTCTCPSGLTGPTCLTDINECASAPCKNGGICHDGRGGYFCQCHPGYTGDRCEISTDECASNPCINGGVCVDGANKYTCTCPPGFGGSRCTTNINECTSAPCQNGGFCTDGVNGYSCNCTITAGFTGTHCEIAPPAPPAPPAPCNSSPCQNGGVCTNNGGTSYTCACDAGWTGTNCDQAADPCNSSPCQNGGVCTNNGGTSYTCACDPGWTGTNCGQDIDECASSPCQNGGVCSNGANKYTCACDPAWIGTNCDTPAPTTSPSDCNACTSEHVAFGFDCTTAALPGWLVDEMNTYGDPATGTKTCQKGCYLRIKNGVTSRGCVDSLSADPDLADVLPTYIPDGGKFCYPTSDKICFCQGNLCTDSALDTTDGDPNLAGKDLADTTLSVCDCNGCRKECSTSPALAKCDCPACGCVYP